MAATEPIEKAIRELEGEQATIAQALIELRATLARMRNGTPESAAPPKRTAPGVFERKYEHSAKEYIVRALPESSRKAMHIGQIRNALAAQGREYRKQTIALNVKQLLESGKVKQVKAPSGSGFSHAYYLAPDRPSAEEESKISAQGGN